MSSTKEVVDQIRALGEEWVILTLVKCVMRSRRLINKEKDLNALAYEQIIAEINISGKYTDLIKEIDTRITPTKDVRSIVDETFPNGLFKRELRAIS